MVPGLLGLVHVCFALMGVLVGDRFCMFAAAGIV